MLYCGLDLSFDGTGLIILNESAEIIEKQLIKSKTGDEIEFRILFILNEIIRSIDNVLKNNDNLLSIYIEGPSYQSKGQSILEMGALNYYIRIYFYQNKMNYKVIPPGSLKKFVTGKGNAKKNLMLLKVFKKWGVEFDDDNLADAYSLARLALEE